MGFIDLRIRARKRHSPQQNYVSHAGEVTGGAVLNPARGSVNGDPEATKLDPRTRLKWQDLLLQPDEPASEHVSDFDVLVRAETSAVLVE
jgi:hypothetical protein